MKRLFMVMLFAPALAMSSQQNPTREELLATIRHIESLAQETQQELNAEKVAHSQTQTALAAAQQSVTDTQNQFSAYQIASEAQIQKGNEAIAKLDHVLKQLHRAKLIANVLVIAVAGFVALKIPPPLGFYIAGAVAVAGTAGVWMFL